MNINTISYLVADAFHTMKKDLKNELISLGTMLATMVLISVAYLVYANANVIISNTKDESSNVLAYLEVGLSDEEAKKIGYEIEDIAGVTGVKFRSVEESIDRAESISSLLVEGYTKEELEMIYQPCYIITFDNIEAVPGITSKLRKIEGIGSTEDDIRVNPYALKAQRNAKIYQTVAITAMILIVEFSVFLMMNTTKLMMYAKRREISIMKYVGARDNFIKAPFAIQGVITALISVLITMLLVSILYPIIVASIDKLGSGYSYLEYESVSQELLIILVSIGCLIGIGGSTASMNKYLDV
ncbi:MAG: permease-like cell division protein FtsX [Clostridia bacterium]|nr:permease-like cell division protein FtsX [Clostridia bacterium]